MGKLALILAATALVCGGSVAGTTTVNYGWEDGYTILGYYGNVGEWLNVEPPVPDGPAAAREGTHVLQVSELPLGGTPQVYLAFIENVSDGDVIEVSFYGWDDTPGASPSLRIWAHYADTGDVNSYRGSAGGSDAYTAGNGWDQVSYSWTFDAGDPPRDALVIEARLYSSVEGQKYWIDDMTVTVTSDTATIRVPDEELPPPPEPDEIPIYSIQTGLISSGERVKVYGVCTTGTGDVDNGFFLQDPNNFGGGPEYNGIWVYNPSGSAAVTAGDTVKIIGEYYEYYDQSQIRFERFSEDSVTPAAMPAPVPLNTGDFADPVFMEPYEGVRVSVSNAQVVNQEDANGNWVVDDGSGQCLVSYEAVNGYRASNGDWVDLVGPVRYSYSEFKIVPGGDANVHAEYRLSFPNPGWKMFSSPLRLNVPIADCSFDDGAERKSFADAAAAGWVQDPIYYYENTYKTLRPAGGDDDTLRGSLGYWMLLYQSGLTMIIPVF